MPKALSLLYHPIRPTTTQLWQEVEVPWEVESYEKDFYQSKSAGFFDFTPWWVLSVEGPDAQDFLHRMSTADLKTLEIGQTRLAALLTGRAKIISWGQIQRIAENQYLYVTSPSQGSRALEHLQNFHFAEDLTLSNVSDQWGAVGILGTASPIKWLIEGELALSTDRVSQCRISGVDVSLWEESMGRPITWMRFPRRQAPQLFGTLSQTSLPLIGMRVFEFYRIRAKIPTVGVEASENDIILETGFEAPICREKGCYPGQEVVERIYTYGSVNRKLVGIELTKAQQDSFLQTPICWKESGQQCRQGEVASLSQHPEDPNRAVGLAYFPKGLWDSHETFLGPGSIKIRQR